MTARRVPIAIALLAVLSACAGAPSPRTAPTPVIGVEGTYAFSGFVRGAGPVEGVIHFDSAGTATMSSGGRTCASAPRASGERFWLSCGGVAIGVAREDDRLEPHARLSVAVTEVVDRPADAFECRGESTIGPSNCVGHGVKRTTRARRIEVSTVLSRVE